ncbi:MAG: GntR family transcriptional regulator [Candidatus Solibacter usitatus]|nr:GntR family transcriptional regulator [Candidatus Solibacter usitatus]
MIKKLKIPSNLTSLAYKSIKEHILEGRLDDGARLTEEFLAKQLGISKSPIREALNRLETEGLIHIEARRGAYLRHFSIREIQDLYEVREALEVHAVRTGSFPQSLIKDLRRSVKRLREHLAANEKGKYIDEDMAFHAAFAGATGNQKLCEILENLQNQIWLFRRKTYDISSSDAPNSHDLILDALESGDRVQAEKEVSRHVSDVRNKLVDFLSKREAAAVSITRLARRTRENSPELVLQPLRVRKR